VQAFVSASAMMRNNVETAIRRWSRLGLNQKELARRVGISETALSHTINDPYYTIGEESSRRIIQAVDAEEATRIAKLPMVVVAFCHGPDFVESAEVKGMVLSSIRSALEKGTFSNGDCELPEDVGGVLIRLGGSESPFFLITLNTANTDQEKVALAHELDHVRKIILQGVSRPHRAPRSSF
jgi:hypothetical protein